jgi:hypothetical protein
VIEEWDSRLHSISHRQLVDPHKKQFWEAQTQVLVDHSIEFVSGTRGISLDCDFRDDVAGSLAVEAVTEPGGQLRQASFIEGDRTTPPKTTVELSTASEGLAMDLKVWAYRQHGAA